jgi:hypothetical protein
LGSEEEDPEKGGIEQEAQSADGRIGDGEAEIKAGSEGKED